VKKLGTISLGIALFTMFFGAGNIVFPLLLGRSVEGNIYPALIGFILTGVIVPIIGFVSTMLYEGNYENFFANIGKIPAKTIIFFCMIIIGILAASRCVILSYASVQPYVPNISLTTYSIFISFIIFILTFKENLVVKILGRVLGPAKITLLISILFLVVLNITKIETNEVFPLKSFFKGLGNGYLSLDLIGALFFSHLIYQSMKGGKLTTKQLIKKGTKVGLFGGLLLAIIYAGFSIVAALYSKDIANIPNENLFSALSIKILGNLGGVLANAAVAIATLTTAMSLITIFADYLSNDILKGRLPYTPALIFTILVNLIFENLKFSGIMMIIEPIALILYPSLIALSIACILKKLFNFKYVKTTTFVTFIVTAIGYLLYWTGMF
jgi:LIVCS family branched-chain amino acid:cation transporter